MKSQEKEYKAVYWQKWAAINRPHKERCCEKCGESYHPHGPQKRCFDCRFLICECCHKKFIPGNSTLKHKFCSQECKVDSQKGVEPEGLKNKRGKKPRTYHLTKREKHGSTIDREWRKAVFERDKYTCQECGKVGGKLEAHHIKAYKESPEEKWKIDNGKTLCKTCHSKTDTYGWANYHKHRNRS